MTDKKSKKKYKWISECEAICQFRSLCIGKDKCKPNMRYERVEVKESELKGD